MDHFEEDTARVLCDLVPEGQRYLISVCRRMWSPLRYEHPACRLGIMISGVQIADGVEGQVWILKRGNSAPWIPRINRLVNWLFDQDNLTNL